MIDDRNLRIELVWDSDQTVWIAKVEEAPGLELEAESIDGLIRHMTDQELLRLTKKVVSELYTRQKYKSASIIQEAVQAKESNNVNRFHELCARVGESRATEEILRQFLGRF